jgi:hypothetical protein
MSRNKLEGTLPLSRVAYEEYLNDSGIPERDKWSNGGRIPLTTVHYGTWLRSNDPIAFNAGYQDWLREQEGGEV